MKLTLKRILPEAFKGALRRVRDRIKDPFATHSYAQEGEDMVLRRLFEAMSEPGFYVDVGAHHPRRFSNTYYFYRRGWRGINIDATPGVAALFDKQRPRDINVEAAVSEDGRNLELTTFDESALNTLSAPGSAPGGLQGRAVRKTTVIKTTPLRTLLERYLPGGQAIHFMSVDVEGMDLEVLRGNDWKRFRPQVLLVECYGLPLGAVSGSAIASYLRDCGYEFAGKTVHTCFFKDLSCQKANSQNAE